MNQEAFNILAIALSIEAISCASALGFLYYHRHLRKNIKALESKYLKLYGKQPQGPLNDTMGGLSDYRTSLKYSIGLKL
jgi:hypothetical protein